ncbi:hypothetical protein GGF46_001295 [Coemansia sp. RSA 552]|nr:hypothetical protein GGF46_001295 [Coemansia sp. RSA 552]
MSLDASGLVELRVRSPSVDTPDDFRIRVPAEHSISQVKAAIEQAHQAAPLAREMRVIWKGRILSDSDAVQGLCGGDEDTAGVQTLHFVLNTPMRKLAQKPAVPQTRSDSSSSGAPPQANSSSSSSSSAAQVDSRPGLQECSGPDPLVGGSAALAEEGTREPRVVPLGNQFQYVLVDGMPYLMVQDAAARQKERADDRLRRRLNRRVRSLEDIYAQLERVRGRLQGLGRDAEAQRASAQAVAAAAAPAAPAREGALNNRAALAGAIRGLGPGSAWSFVWMLLRMLLLVVVLAHDASLERVLVLVALIGGFALIRSSWAQRGWTQLARQLGLRLGPGIAREPPEPREYSVLEKARALVVALFTSLVPSEPFQIPAAEA